MYSSSMNRDTPLSQAIANATKFQELMFYGIAGFIFLGALVMGVAVIFAPTQPGEEPIRNAIAGVAVICVLTGIWLLKYAKRTREQVLRLIYQNPGDIAKITHVKVRSKGITANAVHLITKDGKKYGLNVPTESHAEALIKVINAQLNIK